MLDRGEKREREKGEIGSAFEGGRKKGTVVQMDNAINLKLERGLIIGSHAS